jgi:hypothetical protein
MAFDNAESPVTSVINLGSPSSAATLPGIYFPKKAILVGAHLLNGGNVAAQAGSYLKVELQDQDSAVIAKVDTQTDEEGAITTLVGKELTILEEEIPAGTSLKAVYSEQEGVAEITRISVPAEMVGDDLDGTGFLIYDEIGSVDFWFDIDDGGTTEPTNLNTAGARAVEVSTVSAADDAETIATKLATAMDADSKFIAVVDPEDPLSVLVTSSTVGTKTDATDGLTTEASGLTIAVETQGIDAVTQALTNAKLALSYFYV